MTGIFLLLQPFTYQAYEGDGLDWNEFGIVMGKDSIPRINEILREIPQDVIDRKRSAMERVRNRFIWTSTNYNPFKKSPQEVSSFWVCAIQPFPM